MPDLDTSADRRELHALVDHIPEPDVASARNYLRSLVGPVELALRNAPADDEPMSQHEQEAWERTSSAGSVVKKQSHTKRFCVNSASLTRIFGDTIHLKRFGQGGYSTY